MLLKNVEKKEDNTVVFQVEADKAEFDKAVNSAYLKNKGQIYIPGFRKGKAPRAIIEGLYGHEVAELVAQIVRTRNESVDAGEKLVHRNQLFRRKTVFRA